MDKKIVFVFIGVFIILLGLTTTFSILYTTESNGLVIELTEIPPEEIVEFYQTRTALISSYKIVAAVFGSLTGISLVIGAWLFFKKKR